MNAPIGSSFCNAEHAARIEPDRDYKTSLAHLVFIAAWEAEKAKRAARTNIALHVINMFLLAVLIWLNA